MWHNEAMDRQEARLWRLGRRGVQFGVRTPLPVVWRLMAFLALVSFLMTMVLSLLQSVGRPTHYPVIHIDDASWRGDVPPANPLPAHDHNNRHGR